MANHHKKQQQTTLTPMHTDAEKYTTFSKHPVSKRNMYTQNENKTKFIRVFCYDFERVFN